MRVMRNGGYAIHALKEGKMKEFHTYMEDKNRKLMNLFEHECLSEIGRC